MREDSPLALRFKEIVADKANSVYDFAQSIGDQRSEKVNRVLRSLGAPSFDMLSRIKDTYPDINLNWLISGIGEKYGSHVNTEPASITQKPEAIVQDVQQPEITKKIPFIQSRYREDYLKVFEKPEGLQSFPSLDSEFYQDGTYVDFEVDQDEMEPTLQEGDIVRARKSNFQELVKALNGGVKNLPYFNSKQYGDRPLVLVIHKDFFGFVLRRLRDADEHGYLIMEGDHIDSQRLRIKPTKAEIWLITEIRKRN